jgi:hypothetical protein
MSNFRIGGVVRGGTAAAGLVAEVFDQRFGGEHLIGAVPVAEDGAFLLEFDSEAARSRPGASLDLVVRVVAGQQVLASSATRFGAGPAERVEVTVPDGVAPALDEHSRLIADIARGLAAAGEEPAPPARLARDVPFVAGKSGRDASSVAMAVLADQEAELSGIPAPLHYALYRAGVPAGPRTWALAPTDTIESVWTRAIERGVVAPELAAAIPAAVEVAATLADRDALDLPTGVGDARMADLLRPTLPEPADQLRFARLFRDHRSTPSSLWTRVRAGFGPDAAARLELDGALADLTVNNAALIAKLHAGVGPGGTADLVAAGFHEPRRWQRELTPDVPVPDGMPGADGQERRDAYASMLATRLRERHPTAVVAAEVASGAIPVKGGRRTREAVAGFLAEHHDRFDLTSHPVDDFLAAGDLTLEAPVRDEVAAIQRVVAVAPTPEAVRGLRTLGFDSARQVATLGEKKFVAHAAPALGGEAVAREAFRRSEQVHTATLAIATNHLVTATAPEVFAVPRSGPAAGLAPVTSLPNLTTLFGPADTAACEQCESVLSPAAYLVDLLEFLDVAPPGGGATTPLQVLLGRRPDLQHIALSCENTEVELPVVDLANEILEHVVAHSSLTGYHGHDVSADDTSAALLASPRFVDDAAYPVLRGARYPYPLPWDQRLAALRGYLGLAGLTLHDAMAALAPDDAHGRSWSDVVRERAGAGPADRDLLSGAGVTAQELYGDDPARVSEAKLLDGVSNARRLAARLALTPAELVRLVQTRFVNPDTDLLVLLAALRVEFRTVQDLHDGKITPAAFRAALPAGLDPEPYGGDVAAWVTQNYPKLVGAVVLTDPKGGDNPAFGDLEVRRTLPDPAKNRLRPADLLAIARFVRLRDLLGWSIERTDDVVAALGFDTVLVRLGHLLTAAGLLGLDAEEELPWLLGCFAPLGARGPDSPFRRLFPAASPLGADPLFAPGPNGLPPAERAEPLSAHRPALEAALRLTTAELDAVIAAAGLPPSTVVSVDAVSRLFRYGYLARALGVPVTDLLGLLAATGWKPFDPLDAADPDLLKLTRLVTSLRDAGVPLSWTPPDVPDPTLLPLVRTVRAALADPRVPPGGIWTGATLRTLAPDEFLGLLGDASTYTTPYHQDQPRLPDAALTAAPGLDYDPVRRLLIHHGVLPPEVAAALPGGLAAPAGVLAAAGQAEYGPLLAANPMLAAAWQIWRSTSDLQAVGAALLAAQPLPPPLARLTEALGIDASFLPGSDTLAGVAATGFSIGAAVVAAVDDSHPPATGRWAAVLDPPATGSVEFVVEADGAAVGLEVDGVALALTRSGTTWTAAATPLTAGRPVRLALTASGLSRMVRLRWRFDQGALATVPGTVACPADAVDAFASAYRKLLGVLDLTATLGVTPQEAIAAAGTGWMALTDHLAVLRAADAMARFGKLRSRWGPDVLIGQFAGADPGEVRNVTTHLGAADLTVDTLERVGRALELTRTLNAPIGTLARALRTTPAEPDVADVREAIRARYDAAAWHDVVRPVHDDLRRHARDALVARVLHQENPDPDLGAGDVTGGFHTADELFEQLLIDVSTEPQVTTSRIAQAIATVQLFVSRALLNLEPGVSPDAIDAQRWEAMKRYRVWEANRRVFLFPENWLDPELRDDKSPFFADVESELLQTDITDQAAATALGHYLEKLDTVANLEIAGLHVQELESAGTGFADPIVRVIGRTSGAKRAYFHRTLDGTWMPWQPVNVEIQDDPVLPVIWKGRFLLFWLKVAKQPDDRRPAFAPSTPPATRLGDLSVQSLQLGSTAALTVSLFWSEFYNGRWQSPRTSDPDRPIDLGAKFDVIGDPLTLGLASDIVTDPQNIRDSLGVIVLNPSPQGTGNSHFRLYTTHSLPVRAQDDPAGDPGFPVERVFSDSGPFVVSFIDDPIHGMTLLRASESPYRAIGPMHRLTDPHRAPFFFQDSRHVFYVHPKASQTRSVTFGVFPDPPGVSNG